MTPVTLNSDPWLTHLEITMEYKISKATLSEWRSKRIGPVFRQLGRAIHYRRSAVDAFILTKMIKTA